MGPNYHTVTDERNTIDINILPDHRAGGDGNTVLNHRALAQPGRWTDHGGGMDENTQTIARAGNTVVERLSGRRFSHGDNYLDPVRLKRLLESVKGEHPAALKCAGGLRVVDEYQLLPLLPQFLAVHNQLQHFQAGAPGSVNGQFHKSVSFRSCKTLWLIRSVNTSAPAEFK